VRTSDLTKSTKSTKKRFLRPAAGYRKKAEISGSHGGENKIAVFWEV
jgi:hypothetical protein